MSSKETRRIKDRERKHNTQQWVLNYKSTKKCPYCPEDKYNHPAALSFHHRDPSQKAINVSRAITNRWSINRIMSEVYKCDVICANHHAELHFVESSPNKELYPANKQIVEDVLKAQTIKQAKKK